MVDDPMVDDRKGVFGQRQRRALSSDGAAWKARVGVLAEILCLARYRRLDTLGQNLHDYRLNKAQISSKRRASGLDGTIAHLLLNESNRAKARLLKHPPFSGRAEVWTGLRSSYKLRAKRLRPAFTNLD